MRTYIGPHEPAANDRFRFAPLLIVLVVPAHPERPAAILVPTLRHHVQIMVMNIQGFIATRVTRVGVEDIGALILEKHAVPLSLAIARRLLRIVEKRGALCDGVVREGHVEVEIEIGIAG
jgi:hypothetical protein